jgi:hypothetical protein
MGAGKYQPEGPKALVIDLKTGKRHPATDDLKENLRGRPSDPDLLVFAVLNVAEELLERYYKGGESGIRVSAQVAAIRWPKKEPLGMFVVTADPPPVTFVPKGEIPRGDLAGAISHGITEYSWDNARNLWQAKLPLGHPLDGAWVSADKNKFFTMQFLSDGTFTLHETDYDSPLGMPIHDTGDRIGAKNNRYTMTDKTNADLEISPYYQDSLGKTARIFRVTKDSFKITFELRNNPSKTPTPTTFTMERIKPKGS